MLDIRSYIKKREEYPNLNASEDAWVEKIVSSGLQDKIFFITVEGFFFLQRHAQREALFKKYHVAGIYDLSHPYTSTGVNMCLVELVPKEVASVNISIYVGDTFNKRKSLGRNTGGSLGIPEEYSPEYSDYIAILENWINNNSNPGQGEEGKFEFNIIPIEDMDFTKLYPRYYSRKAVEVRKLLKKDFAFKLSEVADVILPRQIRNTTEEVRVLRTRDFTYPLDIDSLDMRTPTNVQLQKKDILFPIIGVRSPFLYNIDSKEPVYATHNAVVIRCRSILPEYLFFYLNSEAATFIRQTITKGIYIQKITLKDLSNFPIAKQNFEDEKYINDFDLIANVSGRNYGDRAQNLKLQSYYSRLDAIEKKRAKPKHLEDIIDIEWAHKVRVHKEEQLRTLLEDDLRELNTCFAHGAYKAALILAGSILEAVLIDWLSEIKHENYFEKEYMITDRRTGQQRRADLVDYINEIKYIKRPEWMEEAGKAHEIRKKRNLVHAKLCMKEEEKEAISEEPCRKVLDYLRDVLKTRGVSSDYKLIKSKK